MRKLVSIILVVVLLFLVTIAIADVDISGCSYDELVEIVNEAQMLMMKSEKWQEVKVPAGTYLIGRDIPAGYWTISVPKEVHTSVDIYWSDVTNENGQGIPYRGGSFYTTAEIVSEDYVFGAEGYLQQVSWDLKNGQYICIEDKYVVFKPFSGNSFTFK